jgi:DmsE family decaheme c-type cytochrome
MNMKNKKKYLLGLAIAALCIPCFALSGLPQEEGYVGSEMCGECHDDMPDIVAKTIHGKLGPHEMDPEYSCESCHGPGEEHAMSDGEEPIAHRFNDETRESDANSVCASCHIGGETMGWHSSEHSASGLICLDCHDVKKPYAKLSLREQSNLCAQCHADQEALFNLPSHHPLWEQKMGCLDCHNPHGAEETMLRADNVNDLCLDCHADKHGPFLYEHEPVVEDCLICHNAKGAVQNNLLKANETSLCLRCHAGHEDVHPNLSTPERRAGYMAKCTRCHSQIHGSDLPGYIGPSRFIR